MITAEEANQQSERLLTLKLFFHDDPEKLGAEYIRIFMERAVSKDHAKRTVDHIMEIEKERVAPAVLVAGLEMTNPTATVPRKSKCEHCGGVGFIQTTRTGENGMVYSAARFCVCHAAVTNPRPDTRELWKEEEPAWKTWTD